MPIIDTEKGFNPNLVLTLRIIAGLIWLWTVIRRLSSPNFDNFEERISSMAEGSTLFPDFFMHFAVNNWFLFFLIVLSFEIFSSISLLTGTLTRLGALLATLNGFAIGMAGIGLGLIHLIIPWSVAFITLFLLLFTHPGRYYGIDSMLIEKELPNIIIKMT